MIGKCDIYFLLERGYFEFLYLNNIQCTCIRENKQAKYLKKIFKEEEILLKIIIIHVFD
jgi:hypothetical protein